MLTIRRVGSLLLLVAALSVWFGMAPESASFDSSARLADIQIRDAANNQGTEGAPQQAVVNGWTTNDLLRLMVEQDAAAPSADPRPAALMFIGVLAVILGVATAAPVSQTVPVDQRSRPLRDTGISWNFAPMRRAIGSAWGFLTVGKRKVVVLVVVAGIGLAVLGASASQAAHERRAANVAAVASSARFGCEQLVEKIPTEPTRKQFKDYMASLDGDVKARMAELCPREYKLADSKARSARAR